MADDQFYLRRIDDYLRGSVTSLPFIWSGRPVSGGVTILVPPPFNPNERITFIGFALTSFSSTTIVTVDVEFIFRDGNTLQTLAQGVMPRDYQLFYPFDARPVLSRNGSLEVVLSAEANLTFGYMIPTVQPIIP